MDAFVDVSEVYGSAPPTARSGSSNSATPRTGGNTARSDGKGTPRDCERIPLGARPTNTSSQSVASRPAPPISAMVSHTPPSRGSPLGTARSGQLSSTPSSQGDTNTGSWRSRTDLHSHRDMSAPEDPTQSARAPWYSDLSRELEAMRHVILQENARLKEQIHGLKDASACLRGRLGAYPPLDASYSDSRAGLAAWTSGAPVRWLEAPNTLVPRTPCQRRVVEWCLCGFDSRRAAADGRRDRSTFMLPEYPGSKFCLSFGAMRKGCSPQITHDEPTCYLMLRVKGSGCEGLGLRVRLRAEVELPAEERKVSLGEQREALLWGQGSTSCPCAWPTAPDVNILCCAHIEFAGYCPKKATPLRFVTDCHKAG